MKICIYASCKNLVDLDVEKQIAACREYAAQHSCDIVAGYGDLDLQDDIHRPALSWLLKACYKKKYDAVLVYSIKNICTSLFEYFELRNRLHRYGVSIISVSEPPGSPAAQCVEPLWELFCDYYKAEQSQKIRRGLKLEKIQRAEMPSAITEAMGKGA